VKADFIVVGSGVAALCAAMELADAGDVWLLTKNQAGESNTTYAQGGIAAALSKEDHPDIHFADTIAAGDGLCDPSAVRVLVDEGPREVRRLIERGANFDLAGSELALTREAAHTRPRVVHAGGDSTGREISRSLLEAVRKHAAVRVLVFASVRELLMSGGRCAGVSFEHDGKRQAILARSVLLATGGVGRVFSQTTNPEIATGDGVAMAFRAGAVLRDMEFIQFHPTALDVEGAPRFLLSEAMRGEGGRLINAAGERFTDELAPRDVVARAIYAEARRQGRKGIYLDLRHLDAAWVRKRFPAIAALCLQYGIDIATDPIPLSPATHYSMGGIRTDLDGRSTIPGLFAAGECASTGVQGANRLASNSLLEGLVFGRRAALAMKTETALPPAFAAESISPKTRESVELRKHIQDLMWRSAGIVRDEGTMESGLRDLQGIDPAALDFETGNILQLGILILSCARARLESRGGHYRSDYPHRDDAHFRVHSLVERSGSVTVEPLV
jgi:L-aspartate oxidase